MIVEPLVQGAAGMQLAAPEDLAALAAACREHDVLLICDEVATGFGRTGTLFASEQAGIRPDLLCLGKGLTAGYLADVGDGRVGRGVRRVPRPRPLRAHAVPRALVQRERARAPRSRCATSSCIDAYDVLANVRARSDELRDLLDDRIVSLPEVARRPAARADGRRSSSRRRRDGLRWGRRVVRRARSSAACCSARSATSSCSCRR